MRIYCLFEHEIPSFCLHLFSSEKGHTDSNEYIAKYNIKKNKTQKNQRPKTMEQFKTFFLHRQSVRHKKKYNSMQKKEKKSKNKIVTFKTNIRRTTNKKQNI